MDPEAPEAAVLPWNTSPLLGWKRYVAVVGFAVGAGFMIVSFLSGMAAVSKILQGVLAGDAVLYETARALICAGILEASYKLAAFSYGRVGRPREQTLCRDSAIYFKPSSPLRTMRGEGQIEFSDDGLEVRGTLSPSNLAPLAAFVAICAASAPWVLRGRMGFVPVAATACWAIYAYAGGKRTRVFVARDDVKSVTCRGPVVRMRLARAGVTHLSGLRFFVNPSGRDEFFERFDMVFPGRLPSEYRVAAAELRAAMPPSVEEQ